MFVAEEDAGVVGFASCGESRDEPGDGELYGIYVAQEAWGTGAGPALLHAVTEGLREDGYPCATLWVLEENPRARRFYEREGWTLDGGRREGTHLGVRTTEIRYRVKFG